MTNEKISSQKLGKHLQQNLSDVQNKFEQITRQLNECEQAKKKLSLDNGDLSRQIEEAESTVSQLSKAKVVTFSSGNLN